MFIIQRLLFTILIIGHGGTCARAIFQNIHRKLAANNHWRVEALRRRIDTDTIKAKLMVMPWSKIDLNLVFMAEDMYSTLVLLARSFTHFVSFCYILLLLNTIDTTMLCYSTPCCAHVTLLYHASGLGRLVYFTAHSKATKKETFTFIYAFSKCNRIHQFHLFYIAQLIKCVTTAFWHRVVVYRCWYEQFFFLSPFPSPPCFLSISFAYFFVKFFYINIQRKRERDKHSPSRILFWASPFHCSVKLI